MANYTKEEIQAFKEKDERMCRMNALNRAVDITCALIGTQNSGAAVNDGALLERAETYFKYIYGEDVKEAVKTIANASDKELKDAVDGDKDLPQPTQQQDKVLKQIAKQVNVEYNVVKSKVFEKYGKYPTNESSIEKILTEIDFK